jgi:hypothetical protein
MKKEHGNMAGGFHEPDFKEAQITSHQIPHPITMPDFKRRQKKSQQGLSPGRRGEWTLQILEFLAIMGL